MLLQSPRALTDAIKTSLLSLSGVDDVRVHEDKTGGITVPTVFVDIETVATNAIDTKDKWCTLTSLVFTVVVPRLPEQTAGSNAQLDAWDLAAEVAGHTWYNQWGLDSVLPAVVTDAVRADTEFDNDAEAVEIRVDHDIRYATGQTLSTGLWQIQPSSTVSASEPNTPGDDISDFDPVSEHP